MSNSQLPLHNVKVLAFVGDIYEDLELWYPKLRLMAAGAQVVVAGPEARVSYLGKHGYPCVADTSIGQCNATEYNAVLLPGGFMPDKLRRDEKVKSLIRQFAADGKCVAAICHGGWMAISAGVYRGVQVTGSLGIKDDLENAGAIWVDAPVVVDRNFVSSRFPDDLPVFAEAMINVISQQTK
ncbi:MAG TPA: protease [Planctomycetaceae bacterium]|nr:protease [Planctomycetaceae bacterium]